jgi:hypothetical protein
VDYEPEDFANMDEMTEDDVAEFEAAEPATEETPPEAEVTAVAPADWQSIIDSQAAELNQYRSERADREQADYERRRDELPEAERAKFVEEYWRNRDRSNQMETLRKEQAATHPVATVLMGPLAQMFNIEIEDPKAYAAHMDALETTWTGVIDKLVQARVDKQMEAFYAETGAEWGVKKLGGAQPRPLKPRDPVRTSYEDRRKELAKPGVIKTVDTMADLIRKRDRAAKGGR